MPDWIIAVWFATIFILGAYAIGATLVIVEAIRRIKHLNDQLVWAEDQLQEAKKHISNLQN